MTVSLMPFFIGYFQMKKHGQPIREEGPKWHNVKAGTPTMGGAVFLVAITVTSLIFSLFQCVLTGRDVDYVGDFIIVRHTWFLR